MYVIIGVIHNGNEKKKLSGYQNRKRKVEKEETLRKQSGSIDTFFKQPKSIIEGHLGTLYEDFSTLSTPPNTPSASKSNNNLCISSMLKSTHGIILTTQMLSKPCSSQSTNSESEDDSFIITSVDMEQHDPVVELNDPANWPQMTDKLRIILTESGPVPRNMTLCIPEIKVGISLVMHFIIEKWITAN